MPIRHDPCNDNHNLNVESTNSESGAKRQHVVGLYLCKVSSSYHHISQQSYSKVVPARYLQQGVELHVRFKCLGRRMQARKIQKKALCLVMLKHQNVNRQNMLQTSYYSASVIKLSNTSYFKQLK